jgi:SH3-like domain-containing protein
MWILALLFISPLAEAASVCVARPETAVRAAANARSRLLWMAPLHTPFLYLRAASSWFQVEDMDGQRGWVLGSHVTQKHKCAMVRNNLVPVFEDPSAQRPLRDYVRLDRYWPLKRLDRQGEWLRVEDLSQRKFWVRETDVWLPLKSVSVEF